jgi:hypothetical protein
MRLKLSESPAFAKMKEEGEASKAPYAEAFGQWKNMKLVILAFLSMMCAQGPSGTPASSTSRPSWRSS